MNSNYMKPVLKKTKVKYGKNLLFKGIPVIFKQNGPELIIGDDETIKSSFLSNLVRLYSPTIIVTRAPGAVVCGNFPPYSMIVGNPAKVIRRLKGEKADDE